MLDATFCQAKKYQPGAREELALLANAFFKLGYWKAAMYDRNQESEIRKQQTAVYLMDSSFAPHFHVSRIVVPGTRNLKKADSRNGVCLEECGEKNDQHKLMYT